VELKRKIGGVQKMKILMVSDAKTKSEISDVQIGVLGQYVPCGGPGSAAALAIGSEYCVSGLRPRIVQRLLTARE
jgi:hypothetical protein